MARKRLGDILIDLNLITPSQLSEALMYQKETGQALGSVLIELGFLSQEDIESAIATQEGISSVDINSLDIPHEVIQLVPSNMALSYKIIPIAVQDNTLTVAMANAQDVGVLEELHFLLGMNVEGKVSNEADIEAALNKHYGTARESFDELVNASDDTELQQLAADFAGQNDIADLERAAHLPAVVRFMNLILYQAIKDRAADVHLEPFENDFKIRYRIDGVLYDMMPPPKNLAAALTSRVKVMANLNIAERRLPQDGRIMLTVQKRNVDLRVSTLPTMFGESVVMRILDRSVVSLDLEQVGMLPDDLETFKRIVLKPNGIILVTGPTGSGKTTTLYSALVHCNKIEDKIITTEDPVEYDLDGIIQVQIDEIAGRTFPACLRSILRQDPDKILVGEIRDLETAQIAIQASLTGHIVFSTLHTNDAPSTITRILDMGVEPFLLTATLEAIIAQRLVRTICNNCKEEYVPTEDALLELDLKPEDVEGKKFWYGRGCNECNKTGYRGRTALFEMMVINDEIREKIMKWDSTEVIREVARQNGMRTLRDSGLLAIYDGRTSIEEVQAVIALGS